MTKQEVGEVQSSSDTFSLKYVIVVFSTFLYWRDSMMSERQKVVGQIKCQYLVGL